MANFFSNFFGANNKPPKVSPFKEAGVSGAVSFGGWLQDREKNPKLSFLQRQNNYDEIIKNVAIVGAGVRFFCNLGAGASWNFEASEADKSGQYAEWFESQLDKTNDPWSKIVRHALMHNFLGFAVLEKTAARDAADGSIFWRSIENRPQNTIEKWYLDDDGSVTAFGQFAPVSGEELIIPREKCFYIADNLIDDSPAGTGVLRHVFKTAERLEEYNKLETQGFARDLRGIPFGRVPYSELTAAVNRGEISKEDAKAAIASMEKAVQLQVKSSNTGFLLDSKTYSSKSDTGENVSSVPQYDIGTVQGDAPGLADMGKAIERLQAEVARVMGVEGLLLHGAGSNAMSRDKSTNLYLTINACLNDIAEQATKDVVKPLFRLNGIDESLAPRAVVEDVNAKDAEQMAAVLRDMAAAGAVLAPDDPAITEIRNALGLSAPEFDAVVTGLDG